ncbi:AAA family ATPase [Gemmatimonas sp. UBA7669]|uniref:AAA family ATPase n=1 Tax=Gemmatimonas sp. UBA7669 TaxID=1946568 RepID=UPI0025BC37DF|nr:AAA family ATPase [Gemmatimonas sp. UBA7669]
MRIDLLRVENFKGFSQRELAFHPEFNLVIGENGTGKTSVLDALAVAAGSWFLGLRGYDSRHIRSEDVRLKGSEAEASVTWEQQFPCVVEAQGVALDQVLAWRRTVDGPGGRTTYREARDIKSLGEQTERAVREGEKVVLPLISYYGTGRLWDVPREQSKVRMPATGGSKTHRSRLEGYRNSVDPRLSVAALVNWIAQQSWLTFQQEGRETSTFAVVRDALVRNVQGARQLAFDARLGEAIIHFENGKKQPFMNLSDGQRCMLAVVGDMAQKAATLNPHLGERVLADTPGLVLIDELDLHLHPTWQRHVIEDLRTTFPRVQFICTTHSPFLIQSLRSGDELVMLDGQPTAQLADLSIEDIARGIQRVPDTSVSARYTEMKQVAKHYLETLEEAAKAPADKLADYKQRLAAGIAPYADNPAFQAFLEMKRAAKLGE